MSKLVDTIREARIEMERLASASDRLAESLSPGTGGLTGAPEAGSFSQPPVTLNFNETFNTILGTPAGKNVTTSDKAGPRGTEDLQRAFAYFQMSYVDKSEQYQRQIVELFLRLTKKVDGLPGGANFRMMGGG